ncbi:MAG: HypC/HybG/HupF family hydrogenase formation chaperone [Desulfatibacillaceae bacterium]
MGTIDVEGMLRDVSLILIEEPCVGDYVIVHAGFAIQKVDEEEALESLKVIREMVDLMEDPSVPMEKKFR